MDLKLKVVNKPIDGTRTVLIREPREDDFPSIIRGKGEINMLCGYCRTVLAEGISDGQLSNVVLKCPICKNYNNVP